MTGSSIRLSNRHRFAAREAFHGSAQSSISNKDACFVLMFLSMFFLEHYQSWAILGITALAPMIDRHSSRLLLVSGFFISLKVLLSYVIPAAPEYQAYGIDYEWFVREPLTLLIDCFCFSLGLLVFDHRHFERFGLTGLFLMAAASSFGQYISYGFTFFSTINSTQAIVLVSMGIFLNNKRRSGSSIPVIILALGLLGIPQSSFTVIATSGVLFCSLLKGVRDNFSWKAIILISIAFLTFASLFAEIVNLRGVRESGEGNNGAIRELFAREAIDVASDNFVTGTAFGGAIVPYQFIQGALGWSQYFTQDTESANPYALSFHNGFLYLLTRFGVFSFLILYAFIYKVPRSGPPGLIILSVIMLLSISANVVVESVRAGPGVALVLGTLFSFKPKIGVTGSQGRPIVS